MNSNNDGTDSKPKRRERYKGTHPRRFQDKYKELNPEKYQQDIQKIKASGKTPAGTHIPIAVDEILNILKPQPGEVGLDATLGYGGHSWELLQKVHSGGVLIGLDQDPLERPKTQKRLESKITEHDLQVQFYVGGINFSQAKGFLRQIGHAKVDFVLADLGLSSMQMDTPERGFSYKIDAPFDLRMNPDKGASAADVLKALTMSEIQDILVNHSDEPHARQIAQQLFLDRPQTTIEVARSVEKVTNLWSAKVKEKEGNAPIRRVFQAFRILVNQEFESLDKFLEDLPYMLNRGGRVAILSFHSGEDRRVKKSFQNFKREGIYSEISEDLIRPSLKEQGQNPRSKSAKLRWAMRA